MATITMHVLRAGKNVLKSVCPRKLFVDQNFLKYENARFLYTDQALGLDKYAEQRERVVGQFTGLKDRFFSRMKEYVSAERQSMVFTEDLKNMVYMAENKEQDVELCIELMKKFHKQNKELRFGTFIFGPVAMRWVHFLDKPNLAHQLLTSEELIGFFDQVSSYQIAMDLLFKHKRYEDVLSAFEQMQQKKFHGARFPRDPVLLALGACYHLNTPESYEKSMKIIQGARENGETVLRRGLTFAASLALKQGHPEIAMEMLSLTPFSNYITVRNLRLQVLAELNRLEDVFPILRQIVDRDIPRSSSTYQDICQETLESIQKRLELSKDKEMLHIFEQICRALRENNLITGETIEGLLSMPIQAKTAYRGEMQYPQQSSTSRPSRTYGAYRGDSFRDRDRGGQFQHRQTKDHDT